MAGHIATASRADWNTPELILAPVRTVFHAATGREVGLDPCSNATSTVRARTEWRFPEHDGLKESWRGYLSVFINPPFGRPLDAWVEKVLKSRQIDRALEIIMLLPADLSTDRWREMILPTAQAFCVPKRIKFLQEGKELTGAPMACALVYWGNHREIFARHMTHLARPIYLHE